MSNKIWKQSPTSMVTNDDEVSPINAKGDIKHCVPVVFPEIFVLIKMVYISTATLKKKIFCLNRTVVFDRSKVALLVLVFKVLAVYSLMIMEIKMGFNGILYESRFKYV